ncbi:MAG TPA: TOBE domain-containing protein, partial [Aggregatilineales bacterium]|nr:TOBE domain-containing protein [Aggregatilineales bacterium]
FSVSRLDANANHFIAQTSLGAFPVSRKTDTILLHPAYLYPANDKSEFNFPVTVHQRVFRGNNYQLLLKHESGVTLNMQIPATSDAIPAEGESLRIAILEDGILPLDA